MEKIAIALNVHNPKNTIFKYTFFLNFLPYIFGILSFFKNLNTIHINYS